MRFYRSSLVSIALLVATLLCAAQQPKPKLIVAIMIDQFRYDYLTRFGDQYHRGLHQLLTNGAVFTNAFYQQVPTVTAVGHSIFMSGAMPAVSGIVQNAWYDRDERAIVTSVCDWNEKLVGGHDAEKGPKCSDDDPASPRRLLVTTVGDEIRNAHENSKVIGISIKARAAILPSGHRANAAYWFDDVTGNFISSTFYVNKLPDWAVNFNQQHLPAGYVNRRWDAFPKWSFRAPSGSKTPFSKLPASPWGNELIEKFAEQAVSGEQLGQHDTTDMLTVSFSSNDYVGHAVGPDAPEVRDMAIRTDEQIGKLFQLLDQKVGLKNVLIVLSADHGVATAPAVDERDKLPGGYIAGNAENIVKSVLNKKFGETNWITSGGGETALYLDWEAISHLKTPPPREEVYAAAKEALFSAASLHVARVYTRRELENGVTGDFIAAAEMNGYFPRRSADLMLIFEPGYMPGSSGTTHFSPYAYDRHVPVIFMGPGVRAGRYDETIAPNDIAPTLATMLDVQTPSGSSGRVLTEMLTH